MLVSGSNVWTSMSANTARRIDGATAAFAPDASGADGISARKEFDDYARKTPAERMRESILRRLNLTEEELAGMDAETRAQVEAKIKQMTEEETIRQAEEKKQKGLLVDLKA